jgi:hypothetical protein
MNQKNENEQDETGKFQCEISENSPGQRSLQGVGCCQDCTAKKAESQQNGKPRDKAVVAYKAFVTGYSKKMIGCSTTTATQESDDHPLG